MSRDGVITVYNNLGGVSVPPITGPGGSPEGSSSLVARGGNPDRDRGENLLPAGVSSAAAGVEVPRKVGLLPAVGDSRERLS